MKLSIKHTFKMLTERFFELRAVKVYMSDIGVRHSIYLLRGLISGILYSAFNMFAAILYNSRWFASVAIYYILLVVTRYILFLTGKNHEWGNAVSIELYKNCRTVGIVMLLLNVAMASMIVYTIATERGSGHSPLVVYLLAIYTVSIFVFNAVSLLINRKRRLPYSYLISRIISLCASFMSMFNLANSLTVGIDSTSFFSRGIKWGVGGAVILAVLILCLVVIAKCNKRIRECKVTQQLL